MTFVVDLFFSFRSPYSYLALTKTRDMVKAYDVMVRLRPVYPIAVRHTEFLQNCEPEFRQVHLSGQRESCAP
jgi:2-hydroxychromene-2-carboxylate isomerase